MSIMRFRENGPTPQFGAHEVQQSLTVARSLAPDFRVKRRDCLAEIARGQLLGADLRDYGIACPSRRISRTEADGEQKCDQG